jgi:hypothetical protein
VPQKDRAKLEMTFGTASKKFCLTIMHSISIFRVSILHSCFLINANDRIKADKFTVGNKYDSDESFIHAVIKVQLGKEESLTEDKPIGPTAQKSVQGHLLYHL